MFKKSKRKNILIIGNGYIGGNLYYYLNKKYNVSVFSHNKKEESIFFNGDCSIIEQLEPAFKNISCVIFAAGNKSVINSTNPNYFIKYLNDIVSINNVIILCKKYNVKLIYLSSSAIYKSGLNVDEDYEKETRNLYATIKLLSEEIIKTSELKKYIILRCFNIVGGDKKIKQDDIFYLISQNKEIEIFGNIVKDYLYIDDLFEAIEKSIKYKNNETFNIGSGKDVSMIDILMKYKNITVINKEKNNIYQDYISANISLAKKKLKWFPKYNIDYIIKSYGE